MKTISVLGSTGSIGTQTLDVVRERNDIRIVALAAGDQIDLLERQAREFSPAFISCKTKENASLLRAALKDTDISVGYGTEGLLAAATIPEAEMVVGALVGMMGISPAMAAIDAGKDLALANKETLVAAGHLIMPKVKEKGVRLIPVDSEHSAIFQCLSGENRAAVEKIYLTASGGPFRGRTLAGMQDVTPEEALKHPNWSMGKKVTIDSATMVNKGLEVMEARWLFDLDFDQIEVLIQPKSLIHSMVQFRDGAVMAQLGAPDMRVPISYALSYPDRSELQTARLDFSSIGQITFEAPDYENFPGLPLAFEAGKRGGNMPAIYNAANEKAVAQFLDREISFPAITEKIKDAMEHVPFVENPDLSAIFDTERMVYERMDQ